MRRDHFLRSAIQSINKRFSRRVSRTLNVDWPFNGISMRFDLETNLQRTLRQRSQQDLVPSLSNSGVEKLFVHSRPSCEANDFKLIPNAGPLKPNLNPCWFYSISRDSQGKTERSRSTIEFLIP